MEEAGRFERTEGGAPLGRFDAVPASFPNTLASTNCLTYPHQGKPTSSIRQVHATRTELLSGSID
jgi:hypothetical protein